MTRARLSLVLIALVVAALAMVLGWVEEAAAPAAPARALPPPPAISGAAPVLPVTGGGARGPAPLVPAAAPSSSTPLAVPAAAAGATTEDVRRPEPSPPPPRRPGAASLQGLLVAADGAPAAGHHLTLRHGDGIGLGRTGADGTFAFPDVEPGPIELWARPGAHASAMLAAGQTSWVELRLRARPCVSGVVVAADGPVPRARVVLQRVADDPSSGTPVLSIATARSDGSFSLAPSEAGLYGLFATDPRAGCSEVETLPLAWGEERRVRVRIPAPGTLRGRVVDAGGRAPAAGARLTARLRSTPELSAGTILAEDGHFRLDGLPDGDYDLTVNAPCLLPVSVLARVPGAPLEIVVTAAGTVAGTVRRHDGQPLRRALQLLAEPLDAGLDAAARRHLVPADGRYLLESLHPGTWRLAVSADGDGVPRLLAETTVPVRPGRSLALDLFVPE